MNFVNCRKLRRGAGVAYQARLESVCSLQATVGSNPTLSAILSLFLIWQTALKGRLIFEYPGFARFPQG